MDWIISICLTVFFVALYFLFCLLTKNRQKKFNCGICGSRMVFFQRVQNALKDGEMLDIYKCPKCGTLKKMPVGNAGCTR